MGLVNCKTWSSPFDRSIRLKIWQSYYSFRFLFFFFFLIFFFLVRLSFSLLLSSSGLAMAADKSYVSLTLFKFASLVRWRAQLLTFPNTISSFLLAIRHLALSPMESSRTKLKYIYLGGGCCRKEIAQSKRREGNRQVRCVNAIDMDVACFIETWLVILLKNLSWISICVGVANFLRVWWGSSGPCTNTLFSMYLFNICFGLQRNPLYSSICGDDCCSRSWRNSFSEKT